MTLENNKREIPLQNAIYFENIKYGLDHYNNEIVVMNETEAFGFFAKKLKEAEEGSIFADFYYGALECEAKHIIDAELTEEEQKYVAKLIEADTEEIIYPLDHMLLQIIVKLNARATLFSTIYFTGEAAKRSTWWGNYNQEYIVFTEKE